MRIGLMIEGQEDVSWEQWRKLAHACEIHGLDSLFRSDHYLGLLGDETRGSMDAWATLVALAGETERIRLGTLVSPVTFRHPAELAKIVTVADIVSDGRVELGMGAGWNEREHAAYGFDFPALRTRMTMLEEQFEIVRRLTTDDVVDFDGEHYRLDSVRPLPRPVQKRLPMIVGGEAGPRSAAVAARWADEYNTVAAPVADLRERRQRLDRACEVADRDPASLRLSLMTGCILGQDGDEVRHRTAAVMRRAGADGDPDEFARQRRDRWIIGTTDQVVERLAALADAGIGRVMLQHLAHTDLDMVGQIGEEIIPALP